MSLATQSAKGTAVITGASTGIGAIYASRLARIGYDLIIIARNHHRLNQMASHITADTARNVEVLATDLGDAQQLAAVERRLRDDASITLLVNNAGVGTHTPLLTSDVDQMQAMINLNVVALTRLTYSVVPGFVERGGGRHHQYFIDCQPRAGTAERRVRRHKSLCAGIQSVTAS